MVTSVQNYTFSNRLSKNPHHFALFVQKKAKTAPKSDNICKIFHKNINSTYKPAA